MATASDITTLHIPAAPGIPAATHGSYRGRPGTPMGILALHNFAPAPAGKTYQAWVLHRGTWTSMGTFAPDAAGEGLLVAEGGAFSDLPEKVSVTEEPRGGSPAPTGLEVLGWRAH